MYRIILKKYSYKKISIFKRIVAYVASSFKIVKLSLEKPLQ